MNNLPSLIDAKVLRAIAPKAPSKKAARQSAIISEFGDVLPALLASAAIDSELRIAHFLAQVAHESDGFCTFEEYASGRAYEGRKDLGNTRKGDGERFKGRGPIQITGRDNYRSFTMWMRSFDPSSPNFENAAELAAEAPWAGWAAIWFWSIKRLNVFADRDDLLSITRTINGGYNGLEDRRRYLSKAKATLARLVVEAEHSRPPYNVLYRGSQGEEVGLLQRALAAAGFYALAIDGDFGPGTEGAVRLFQRARGLVVDGKAGRETFAALAPYLED